MIRKKPVGTGPLLREPLEALGFTVRTVEAVRRVPDKFRPGKWKIWTEDFLGMIDDLAFRTGTPGVIGFQRTVDDRFADHVAKVVAADTAVGWSNGFDRRVFVIGFRKRDRGEGQRARLVEVVGGTTPPEVAGAAVEILAAALGTSPATEVR